MHRPTFFPAVAGKSAYGGISTISASAKDQAAHTKLKYRQVGQNSREETVYEDYKAKLDEKEELALIENDKSQGKIAPSRAEKVEQTTLLLKNQPEINLEEIKKKYDDEDVDYEEAPSDDDLKSSDEEGDDDDDDDDDDDEDDEEELQRELERIKAERLATQAKKEAEEKEIADKLHRESALKSNPLVDMSGTVAGSAKVKRQWNDDVVFRNQARDEPTTKKRFVNDTIRSDFHRSFLKKYVR
jgi:protein CWC15